MTTLSLTPTPTISIRAAAPGDGPALNRLAALDSSPVPFGPALIAEVDGAPRAALQLRDGRVIADPFERTAELVQLLKVHAATVIDSGEETRPFGFARRLGLAA
jgi:hypothetical protein